MLQVKITEETQRKITAALAGIKDADNRILKPAIRRGMAAGKVEAAKGVKQVYSIDQNGFARYVKTRNSFAVEGSDVIGNILFSGTVIPLYKFNVTPTQPTFGKKPIRVSVLKSSGQTEFERAFVAEMHNKHMGIFERKDTWTIKGRENKKGTKTTYNEQIKELFGPSVPTMIDNADVKEKMSQRINEIIGKRLDHEIENCLKSGG